MEAAARLAGLDYLWIPVTGGPTPSQADAMLEATRDGRKTLAFCRSGTRSITAWAIGQARAGAMPVGRTRLARRAGRLRPVVAARGLPMIPYVRDIDVEYGRCDRVSPLIRRVTADNPGPFTFRGTGTYIVGAGEVAVIDPGPDLPGHLAAIQAAVAGERVSHILVTHHHLDHSPLARPLAEITGAPVYGCAVKRPVEDDAIPLEAGYDHFTPDVSVCAGGTVSGPGWTLEAIPTPGHTSNHICYALAEENALFSGDHIMGWSTTVITPPDGDMTDYLASLQRIRSRTFKTLWPTHGPPITDVEPFIDAYIAHRHDRERQMSASPPATAPSRLVPNAAGDSASGPRPPVPCTIARQGRYGGPPQPAGLSLRLAARRSLPVQRLVARRHEAIQGARLVPRSIRIEGWPPRRLRRMRSRNRAVKSKPPSFGQEKRGGSVH